MKGRRGAWAPTERSFPPEPLILSLSKDEVGGTGIAPSSMAWPGQDSSDDLMLRQAQHERVRGGAFFRAAVGEESGALGRFYTRSFTPFRMTDRRLPGFPPRSQDERG